MTLQSPDPRQSISDDRRLSDDLLGAFIVLAGAFASWGLWISEVLWVKGWNGLAWLNSFNWASVPICAIILFTSSYLIAPRAAVKSRTMFVGVGSLLAVIAFVAARWAVLELSASMFGASWMLPIFVLASSWLTQAVGLAVIANGYLASVRIWTAPLLAAALVLVWPLSLWTIRLLPAFNGSIGEIHSIKMGYPVFWTAIIVPLVLRVGLDKNAPSGRSS